MISAVIPTLNDETRQEATLAALTAAAIDGFVREVIVADGGSTDGTLGVAEDAGAQIVRANAAEALEAGFEAARQPWLLLLRAGTRPQNGWEASAWRHLNDHGDQAGWFQLSLKAEGLGARVSEARAAIEAGLIGRPRAEQGLLISRRLFSACAERRPASAPLCLPLRPGRAALRRLDARILA
jgi:glycosyltransferase involved in cell wall biosynthesis